MGIILGFLFLLLIFVILLVIARNSYYEIFTIIVTFGTIAAATCLAISLIGVPLQRFSCQVEVREFLAVQNTLNCVRANSNLSELELTAIQHKVVEANIWLAKAQFRANSWLFNWYYVDEIRKLTPIE